MRKITIDLGNANYKALVEGKRVLDSSNIQEVVEGTFGAFEVDSKFYLFGEVAKAKRNTNKICTSKRALMGRALYPLVDDKEKIEVVTLLPLSLYVNQENKIKYSELLKGKYTVTNSNGAKKSFTVASVEVRAESFSSLATEPALLKEPIYLIDLGGVDVSGCFVNRTPDIGKSFTQEKGMNIFYSELGKVLTSKLLETYSDKDAELVFNKYDNLSEDLKSIVDEFAKAFIKENIYVPLKEIGYRELIHKLVFTGGGSKALERYLVEDNNASVLQNALWSNVEGAEVLSRRKSK